MAKLRYIGQQLAQQIDVELMSGEGGFAVEQLMELAGLGCAEAIFRVYGKCRLLVCCGPGNNGGDGLVAARHLRHFGCEPTIFYPKPTPKPLFENLVRQNRNLGNAFVAELTAEGLRDYKVVVDAVFGFSFSLGSGVRAPFDHVLKVLRDSPTPVASVDVPSGWDVEHGDTQHIGVRPDMLISLTAPKLCARFFQGKHHVLAGRFVPPAMEQRHALGLPEYPGTAQSVDVSNTSSL